eukprot:CCRYP_004381-RA/>CCRYP_004381-RA protein AED:0.20 eAED:0.20 QI:196/1/1/1/1/1/2/1250/374
MKYHKLNLATLPDDLFTKQTDVKRWMDLTTSCDGGFPPNSLNRVCPIERDVEIERLFGISFYMLGNIFPFILPLLLVSSLISQVGSVLLKILLAYFAILFIIAKYNFAKFTRKYNRPKDLSPTDMKDNQYLFTERNNQKYTSMQFVWSESIQRPALLEKAVIFCVIPHGVAPLGITAYPVWSKLFNDKLCHWTCAPIVLKIPILKTYMKRIGYIPAKAKNISDTLTKKEENVGIILDGIAGMFQSHDEIGHVMNRKGIIKIALRSGVPIVPVYGFGHTSLWKVVVDPFRVLEWLSLKLDVALTPFFGRAGWFLGPPRRVAVCVCLGEPIECPKIENPTQEEIDKFHGLLLKGYENVFEQHKKAYGWGDKTLQFV